MEDATGNQRLLKARRRLERLAWLLDDSIAIPGTNRRFGLDPIIGLIPGAGDVVGAALSLWLVVEAARLGAPGSLLARMLANVAVDSLAGVVPVVGDIFDFFWKANSRNREILSDYIDHRLAPESTPNIWFWVILLLILLFSVLMFFPTGLAGL